MGPVSVADASRLGVGAVVLQGTVEGPICGVDGVSCHRSEHLGRDSLAKIRVNTVQNKASTEAQIFDL